MNPEAGSRALHAANDLLELLRLAQGAADRLEHEVHGTPYEQADLVVKELRRLRRLVERLQAETGRLVSEEMSAAATVGQPMRRATDRARRH